MIISFCGLIGSGKNAASEYLVAHHGFIQDSFANPLKSAVASVFGWDREALEGNTIESRAWREKIDPWWASKLGIEYLTPRWVLQNWGTELLRHGFHEDIWIASLEHRIRNNNRTVISDCRFVNEVKAIRQMGGKAIRVIRGEDPSWYQVARLALTGDEHAKMQMMNLGVHESEYALANVGFDGIIQNDGEFLDMYAQIDTLISDIL